VSVRMRLKKLGGKRDPHYRVVIADARTPRDSRTIEEIGYYNPKTDPPTIDLKEDRAIHWLMNGVQPSETVASLLRKSGMLAKLAEVRRQQKSAGGAAAAE
jgi:small subunit ribosomal protein S16